MSRRLFILVLLSLQGGVFLPFYCEKRPRECACIDKNWEGRIEVELQCGHRNLSIVPSQVPSSGSEDLPILLLNLSYNPLRSLQADSFLGYEDVRNLQLSHCSIHFINESAFLKLKKLSSLILNNNHLSTITPHLFAQNTRLRKLVLHGNPLYEVPNLAWPPSIGQLDLSACKLSVVPSASFQFLLNLTRLDLSNNKLEVLELDVHRQLKDIRLDNNPWKCGSTFESMLCQVYPRAHAPLQCRHKNGTRQVWGTDEQHTLCSQISTPLVSATREIEGTRSDLDSPASRQNDVRATTSAAQETNEEHTTYRPPDDETLTSSIPVVVILVIALFIVLAVIAILHRFQILQRALPSPSLLAAKEPTSPTNYNLIENTEETPVP